MDRQENKRRCVLQIWEWRRGLWDWEWRCRMAISHVVCLVAYWLIFWKRPQRRQVTYSISNLSLERWSVRDELMKEIIGNKKCRDIIYMGPRAFLDLCDMLRKEGGLQPTQRATIEEQVAKFLYILSHGVNHREISFFFPSLWWDYKPSFPSSIKICDTTRREVSETWWISNFSRNTQ